MANGRVDGEAGSQRGGIAEVRADEKAGCQRFLSLRVNLKSELGSHCKSTVQLDLALLGQFDPARDVGFDER